MKKHCYEKSPDGYTKIKFHVDEFFYPKQENKKIKISPFFILLEFVTMYGK